MPPLLDVALVAVGWTLDFYVLRRTGTWLPLTATAVGLAAYFLWRDPALREALVPRWRYLALGATAALVMIAFTYVAYACLAPRWPGLSPAAESLYQLLGAHHHSRLTLALWLLPTAVGEEILFRGALFRPGPRRLSPLPVVFAAALYAAAHLASGSLPLIAVAFVCGLYWTGLRQWSGSLWPSIVTHAAWDLAILVVYPLV
jgi:membrane protease YdiL (CAAX protease family)